MKKHYYIFVVILLASCTSNTIFEKPKDLIPKDTMVNLLTDLYIASAAVTVKNKNMQLKVKYMPLVYSKYNIDSARFKVSNIYYLSKIDEYGELFERVRDSLKSLRETLRAKEDSLKSIQKNKIKKIKRKKISLETLDEKKQGLKEFNSLKKQEQPLLQKKQ